MSDEPQTPPTEPQNDPAAPAYRPMTAEDLAGFADEWDKNGALSDETFANIEKTHGLPRSFMEETIEGRIALAEKREAQLLAPVGGKQAWEQTQEWANSNLSEEERETFNAAMNSSEPAARQVAMRALLDRRNAAVQQTAPPVVGGGGNTPPAASAFFSVDEQRAAMADARYGKEDKFTKEVDARLAATSSQGGFTRNIQ